MKIKPFNFPRFYVPVYDELKLTTSYQYLEIRFNRAVKTLASTLFSVQMLLYMAIVVGVIIKYLHLLRVDAGLCTINSPDSSDWILERH